MVLPTIKLTVYTVSRMDMAKEHILVRHGLKHAHFFFTSQECTHGMSLGQITVLGSSLDMKFRSNFVYSEWS